MFSRDFRRPKGAKSKHIFEIEEGRRGVEVVACLPFGVSTGCRCVGSLGLFSLSWRVPLFRPLSCFVLGALPLEYAFIRVLRAFLAWFGVVVWVCLVLVLCAACVAFVRVWS